MKNTLFIISTCLLIAGCNQSKNNSDLQNIEDKKPNATSRLDENNKSSNLEISNDEAQEFAKNLYLKIEEDQKFLNDAYELKEYQTLSKYVLNDWPTYANTPHRYAPKSVASSGFTYFPSGEVMYPYAVCDTAYFDLNIYAGAMMNIVRDDSAVNRKILRKEKDDFYQSLAKCKHRTDLTYDEALAEDEKE